MKVRISDIPPKGLHVTGDIPLAPLNERMKTGDAQEIIFTQAPVADLLFTGNLSGAELNGTVSAPYKQACSLCLEGRARTANAKISYLLKPKPEGEIDDDVGVIFFADETIELDDILQEALILSLTLYWHPPFDDADRCKECSRTRDELGLGSERAKTTLGDLLKQKLGN